MSGRPANAPTTRLGAELRQRRGARGQVDVAAEVGIPRATFAQIERGAHVPSIASARALAAWLGWTMEQVIEAAEAPPGGSV
jgi:DNA-binding XRE family transcriptional regulator